MGRSRGRRRAQHKAQQRRYLLHAGTYRKFLLHLRRHFHIILGRESCMVIDLKSMGSHNKSIPGPYLFACYSLGDPRGRGVQMALNMWMCVCVANTFRRTR